MLDKTVLGLMIVFFAIGFFAGAVFGVRYTEHRLKKYNIVMNKNRYMKYKVANEKAMMDLAEYNKKMQDGSRYDEER